MSDKNFTIYVTGDTNVFVPVLSDDPKQVSRVLDSLKRCYGDDDSEEVKAALSFVSDALSRLDYRISTSEMPMITTYSIDEIQEYVNLILSFRQKNIPIPKSHDHYPKTQKGEPLKQASNITRTINQILRICNIIEKKEVRIDRENFYICTEFGKKYVDEVRKFVDSKSSKFWTAQQFRKENLLRQKQICNIGYNNMLDKGGYAVEITDKNVVFSPYQLIPETNVNWLLEKDIRIPPEIKSPQIQVINSQITGQELKLKPTYFTQEDYENFIKTHINKNNLINEILGEKEKGSDKDTFIEILCERHRASDKSVFYPFVHSLFEAMGLECFGEVGRIDGLFVYKDIKIPAEIKSYTETEAYNMKGDTVSKSDFYNLKTEQYTCPVKMFVYGVTDEQLEEGYREIDAEGYNYR